MVIVLDVTIFSVFSRLNFSVINQTKLLYSVDGALFEQKLVQTSVLYNSQFSLSFLCCCCVMAS